VTVVPLFINANKRMLVLAVAILLSYAVTLIFYSQYVVSVWCFFAAVLSAIILWIVNGKTELNSQ
jgi:hypothetical protein